MAENDALCKALVSILAHICRVGDKGFEDMGTGNRKHLAEGRLYYAGLAAIVALAFGGTYYFPGAAAIQEAAHTAAPGRLLSFQPTEAQRKNLRIEVAGVAHFRTKREAEGKIAINDYKTTPIFSPYSGRVTAVFADAGAQMAAGQPLFAIEASEFVQAQNDLMSAINARNKARAQRRLAEINEGRQSDLYAARAAAKRDLEQAQTDLVSVANDLKTAELGVEAVRKRLRILGKPEDEIAALENTGSQINPVTSLLAPIAGTVISRKIALGQYLQSNGTDPVFTIGDLSTVWLVANLRETDAPFVHPGQTVNVRVLALPNTPLTAKIVYVAPSIDPVTRRLAIRAEISNPDFVLKPEMFANFTILSGDEEDHVAVPQPAIVYEGPSAHVWVEGKDRTISSRNVGTGRSNGELIEIRSGLAAGEMVVTGGALFIDRASEVNSPDAREAGAEQVN